MEDFNDQVQGHQLVRDLFNNYFKTQCLFDY